MFGRFLEWTCSTHNIASSVAFYERLGFAPLITGDAFSYRYAVMSDGRIQIGLHEAELPAPALTFVLPQLSRAHAALLADGADIDGAQLTDDSLNYVRLRAAGEQPITLLEARTFSPPAQPPSASLCGYFLHVSLPQPDFDTAREFWERAGFVGLGEEDLPYPHLPLTSDTLDLGFHHPRFFNAPLLVFECAELAQQLSVLRERDVAVEKSLPPGLRARDAALMETDEGYALLLLQAAD